jgi:hypothetical protein
VRWPREEAPIGVSLTSGSFEGGVGEVLDEEVVDLADDVALEAAEDVEVGFAILCA